MKSIAIEKQSSRATSTIYKAMGDRESACVVYDPRISNNDKGFNLIVEWYG